MMIEGYYKDERDIAVLIPIGQQLVISLSQDVLVSERLT